MGSLAGDKDHRVFIDSASGVGGATAVLYANNILSAHQEDYAGADGEYAMIVCFRHAATALGYTDAMWQKYGEVFSRVTRLSVPDGDSPLAVNPLNLEGANFGNIGNTLDHVRGRGVHFAICNQSDALHVPPALCGYRAVCSQPLRGVDSGKHCHQSVCACRRYGGYPVAGVWLQPALRRLVRH